MSTQDRLEINWFNVAGASLGAVSSAVVLSTLGAAGTLVGAALGSLCITVGGAVYAHSMKLTKDRVAAAKSLSEARKASPRESVLAGAPTVSSRAWGPTPNQDQPPQAVQATAGASATSRAKQPLTATLRGLPWKRIAALAGALFAVTLAVIAAFEITTGRAVSTYTGGTSDTSVGSTFTGVGSSGGSDGVDTQDGEGQPNEAPAEDGRPDEAPAQDGQQGEAPAQENQQGEAPAQEGQREDTPAQDAPAQDAPAQDVQQDEAPAEAPAEDPAPAPAPEQPAPAPAPAPAPQPDAPAPQPAP